LPENSGNTLTKAKPERRLIPDGGIEQTADLDRITAEELLRRKRTKLGTEKDHEFRCPICSARCTESTSGIEEYGHYTDCPRRPDHLPRGGKKLEEQPKALATDGDNSP
jgi:hypothetical protein